MSPPSSSSSDDKHGVNEQKYSFRLHQRVIMTHPTEGDFISLNAEQFLVFLVLASMAYRAFKSFSRVEEFFEIIEETGSGYEGNSQTVQRRRRRRWFWDCFRRRRGG